MDISLNGSSVDIDISGYNTLGELMEELRNNHFGNREFISVLAVNGEELDDISQEMVVEKPIGEVTSLVITTDHPVRLSLRTLEKVGPFLDSIVTLVGESADKFRVEDHTVANQHFVQSVEALHTFVEVLNKLKTLNNMDFDQLPYKDGIVADYEKQLADTFTSIHGIQQAQKWVEMADMLEFELIPLLSEWRDICVSIAAHIRSMDN